MPRPRILIVDDDNMLRSSLARVLRSRFDVVPAENGAVAIVIIESGEKFDVILTDVEMPVMDGRKMLERLELLAPEQASRTLVMTGGPRDPSLARWVQALAPERVLSKLLDASTLRDAIEEFSACRS